MRIGIIAAENAEMMAIKEIMNDIEEETIYNLVFTIGNIENKECVLVECGVGKVNAARTTQILIDKYSVDYLINVGSAGGVNKELNILDIVIGDKLVQYDFDISGAGNYEKGEICGIGKFFESDGRLVELSKQIIENMEGRDFNIVVGAIGSADLFCTDPNLGTKTREEFGVECVEMEGAAIAQVCMLDSIPFLVIRGVSDSPNGNNDIDFHTYLGIVSNRVATILKQLVSKI